MAKRQTLSRRNLTEDGQPSAGAVKNSRIAREVHCIFNLAVVRLLRILRLGRRKRMRRLFFGLLFALHATIAHADAESDCIKSFSPDGIRDCTRWIQQDPQNPNAYYSRGTLYGFIGQDDLAIADYSEAIRLDPKHTNAYRARAPLYKAKGKFDLALLDYNKFVELSAGPIAYAERADFYFGRAQFNDAIADYTKALDLSGGWGLWWRGRGLAYEKVGEKTKAIADLRKALSEMPDDGQVRAALTRLGTSP
jgi:tetratricopeptide (TPR) repeat protein